jgi:hypothetical protein
MEHHRDRVRQVPACLHKEIFEQLEAIRVHQVMEDDGVVERPRREVPIPRGAQGQALKLILRRAEEVLSFGQGYAGAVGVAQTRRERAQERGEGECIVPGVSGVSQRRRVRVGAEEQHRAAAADEGGERLVEVGVPGEIAGVVQQLVDDDVRQYGAIVAEQAGQERIVKPAQRAERHGGADVGVVTIVLQTRGFAGCRGGREEALVGDAAQDGEPPGVGLESEAIRR